MYETRWGLILPFDPSDAPLRSTPKAWRSRDPGVFPGLAARMRQTGCPRYFYLDAPTRSTRVSLTVDAFFAPDTLAARLSAQYERYVRWWWDRANPERRHRPTSGLILPGFHDYVHLVVLRPDAPAWIAILEACAPYVFSQWDAVSRGEARTRWEAVSQAEVTL